MRENLLEIGSAFAMSIFYQDLFQDCKIQTYYLFRRLFCVNVKLQSIHRSGNPPRRGKKWAP